MPMANCMISSYGKILIVGVLHKESTVSTIEWTKCPQQMKQGVLLMGKFELQKFHLYRNYCI